MSVDANGNEIPATPQPDPWASLSNYLNGMASSRLNGRFNQAFLNNQRDSLATNLFGTTSNNAARQAVFQRDSPGIRAGQSVRGDVMANAQDAEVSGLPSYIHVGKVSGGLRPSLFSDNTRAVGRGLSENARQIQQNGGDKIDFPTAPTLSPVPEAGALDTALNVGSGAAGAASVLGNLFGKNGAGGQIDLGKLFGGLFNRNRMEYPLSPGEGFGGPGTSTYGSHPGGFDPYGGNDNPYGSFPEGSGVMPDLPGSGTQMPPPDSAGHGGDPFEQWMADNGFM